ncbi:hypothetical protein Rsub_02961 [Raphidocelis subcapitata]|uniref:Nudix hydrolase domain-containing protein n=1 Tax=Raphidocelis subcapitata TaxID=307507 RepID=A0A2V0NQ65_9CHLO|nr:hypothetical protein Rsub_02961 [Raphidocelis subcapitata]|eukprot:GBF89791.1 hypothetical protein Rsub_02961 [Raphidocelis subcapitata]
MHGFKRSPPAAAGGVAVYAVDGLPQQAPLLPAGAAVADLLPRGARAAALPLFLPQRSGGGDAAAASQSLAAARRAAAAGAGGGVEPAAAPALEAALVPAAAGGDAQLRAVRALRAAAPALFIVFCHPEATEDPALRIAAFAAGANMATASAAAVARALAAVAATRLGGALRCAWCGLAGLTPESYWHHQPLHHIYEPILPGSCPICGHAASNLARHLHDCHPPPGAPPPERRTGVFALVVVRRPRDGKFLVTQEFAGQGMWLPGGGVDEGESLAAAAVREAREEAGVAVRLTGVLTFEAHHGGEWRRVIFLGEPDEGGDAGGGEAAAGGAAAAAAGGGEAAGGAGSAGGGGGGGGASSGGAAAVSLPAPRDSPKSVPDFESAGACYASLEQLASPGVPLRSEAEVRWFWRCGEAGPLEMPAAWARVFGEFALS